MICRFIPVERRNSMPSGAAKTQAIVSGIGAPRSARSLQPWASDPPVANIGSSTKQVRTPLAETDGIALASRPVLVPVPSCVTPDNPLRFSTVSAADALDEVIYQINLVEDARRVGD